MLINTQEDDDDIGPMHGERRYVHEWYKDSSTANQSHARKIAPKTEHLRGVKVELQSFDAQKASLKLCLSSNVTYYAPCIIQSSSLQFAPRSKLF